MTANLCLSFDNLGEAAEIGAGALAPDAESVGSHPTATEVLPRLLDRLDAHGLAATFFVEGLNAELYPDLLREIDARGHEVAYHAWAHEQWEDLDAEAQAENLARGIDAFAALGLGLAGMRPPGGALGAGGSDLLRDVGLRYCSPAGSGAGTGSEGTAAFLPFQWRHVDAVSVLPGLGPVRTEMTGSPDPLEPAGFLLSLEADLDRLGRDGGFAAIVLHPFMFEWLGADRLEAILDRVARGRHSGEFRVARCADLAEHVLAHPAEFEGGTALDPTGWSG